MNQELPNELTVEQMAELEKQGLASSIDMGVQAKSYSQNILQNNDGPINFMKRLKLGFGGPAAEQQRRQLEEQSGLRGKFEVGDIADVVGSSLPIVGGILGGGGGTVLGTPLSAPMGMAVGSAAGESLKQAIGRGLGVREDVSAGSEAKDIALTSIFSFFGAKVGNYIASRFPKLLGIFSGESDDA